MTEASESRINGYTIDGDLFKVLVNDEAQHAIWPAFKATPAGWREAGFTGAKAECSDWVDRHWTDMRPASLRRAMDAG
jgi:MbtH protein